MKTRIVTTEIIHLSMLDRLNHRLRNQLQFMVDACQLLGNIQEQGGTTAQQLAAMTQIMVPSSNSMAEEV